MPASLFVPALTVALLSLAPVAYLILREGFSLQTVQNEWNSPSTVPLLTHTFGLALGVSLICAVLGIALAFLVVRTDLPFAGLWTVLFAMPLGVPTFVASYTWLAASLRFVPQSRLLFSYEGVVTVLSLALYPYVFLPVVAALRGIDRAQEEAARSLGCGKLSIFLRVTLPQLRPAIAGGVLIIALHMFAEYGALQLLSYRTLTTAVVQRAIVLGAPEAARSLAVVLAAGAVFVIILNRLLQGRQAPLRAGAGVPRTPPPWRLGRATPLAVLVGIAILALALGVPIYVSITGLGELMSGMGHGVDWHQLIEASMNTAEFALFAALLTSLLALPVSIAAVRYTGAASIAIERAVWLAHSLPGVIMALSLVYIGVHWLYPLYQSTAMLIVDYAILFLPLAVASQQVGVAQAARQYDEIAHSLGLNTPLTLLRVTLRLALPGIGAGAMLVLLNVGKELTTTLLLHPIGKETLTTALWRTTNGDVLDFSTAAPYGIVLMAIGAIPAYLLTHYTLNPRQ